MIGTSFYESFQLKVQRRFSKGASALVAYTDAKLITKGTDSLTGFLETDGGVSTFQDFNNFRAERSLSTAAWVASFSLDLPVGPARRYRRHLNGLCSILLSGWTVEGIATFQSGFPLHLIALPNTTGSFGGGSRPDSTGRSANISGSAQNRLDRWFDTSVFTHLAPFTFGNVARTLPDVRSAGINNWDAAFVKHTALASERFDVQIRAEFYNLFNRVQFSFPGQALGTAQFGVVSGQANPPRLLQVSLRLQW